LAVAEEEEVATLAVVLVAVVVLVDYLQAPRF
jgi:hypothetical protein